MLGQSQLDGAIESLTEAVRLRPSSVPAYNDLGLAWARKGDVPMAVAAFKKALAIDPHNLEVRQNLGGVLKEP